MSQLTFDLEALDAPAYQGPAPLGFTVAYFTPQEFAAAHQAAHVGWEYGIRKPRTWDLGFTTGWCNRDTPGHDCWLLTVDLRCTCRFPFTVAQWEQIGPCLCLGDLLYQANCPGCRWHHIAASENEAVEAWHDHAWPGWRALPVLDYISHEPTKKETRLRAEQLVEYPAEFQRPGAPIITERGRWGGRHVAGRSPWGGFDIAALDRCRWFAPSGPVERSGGSNA